LAAPDLSSSASRSPCPEDAAEPVRDEEIGALFAPLANFPIAILAVSGGADSVALMHLASRWAQQHSPRTKLHVATVDHALRATSRDEAEWVGSEARALGFDHETLTWIGDKPSSGIQDAARDARYRLLVARAHNCAASGPVAIVTAHTQDDQAETLLMRLARGSGLDGLTAMSEQRALDEQCVLLRPLLGVSGARLRATLRDAKLKWLEDPSNDADRFERVRLRKAGAALAGLGLTNDKLALSARRLGRAQAALDAGVRALQEATRLDLHGGAFASFDHAAWLAAPEELRLRLLARLITSYGEQAEPLRLVQLEALADRLTDAVFEGATLGGAAVSRHGSFVRVFRELGRASLPTFLLPPGATEVWDGRFRVCTSADAIDIPEVRALGLDAFAQLRQQLDMPRDLPARAAATLPAFWRGAELIIVPYFAALPGVSPAWGTAQRLYSAEFLG
jgi:tRNA(Ile)-lysidine synthase